MPLDIDEDNSRVRLSTSLFRRHYADVISGSRRRTAHIYCLHSAAVVEMALIDRVVGVDTLTFRLDISHTGAMIVIRI